MLMQILTNTPKWVFVLFVALVWLGLKQMLPRSVSLNRATILPLVMTALSFTGVTSTFGTAPEALLAWLAGAVVAFAISLTMLRTDTLQYDTGTRRFQMAGSAVPLALFMGIFFTKYVVGISMAMTPALAHDTNAAMLVGALYGSFSGIFLARASNLWRMVLRQADGVVFAK